MTRPFDLIIFDWDGTLINSTDWIAHCLQTAAVRCGFAAPTAEAAKNVIGLSIKKAMQAMVPEAGDHLHDEMVAHYNQEYHSKKLSPDDLFDGVYEMLQQLRDSGYLLAVATGKTRHGLQEALQATGTEALFCQTRCADETASKPDPKMLHEIMQATNTPKERAVMVGDSTHDLQMALNAHISAVAVSCGAHPEEFLQSLNPLLCLQHPTELLTHLRLHAHGY